MTTIAFRPEAKPRGARMLRTALGRRLAKGRSLADEVSREVNAETGS